jgi:hypothetical protein
MPAVGRRLNPLFYGDLDPPASEKAAPADIGASLVDNPWPPVPGRRQSRSPLRILILRENRDQFEGFKAMRMRSESDETAARLRGSDEPARFGDRRCEGSTAGRAFPASERVLLLLSFRSGRPTKKRI